MLVDRRVALGGAGIVIASALIGAFLWGNLFTFVTGEYGGVGPGLGQSFGLKVDTTTVITTTDPGRYVESPIGAVKWFTLQIWTLTGKMWVEPTGEYSIFWSRHAGVLLNDGKDWLEDQISDSPGATPAAYISLSRCPTAPAATWNKIFDEIDTGGGLDRVIGTYSSTGVGTWTVSKQFTADGGYTDVQLTGLCWSDTDDSNDTTLCADTFAAVTLAAADKITVTWTCSVS